tara:strand:+ start:95 stop:424 length:330 start_codon:yes stop_codon:yes gene_type:complete
MQSGIEESSQVPVLERWTQHYDTYKNRCLFLENLHPTIDPVVLKDTFSRFGKILISEVSKIEVTTSLFGFAPFLEHIEAQGLKLLSVTDDGNVSSILFISLLQLQLLQL